jgi:hypothetical protein
MTTNDVLVITGAGGIGQDIARRQGPASQRRQPFLNPEGMDDAAYGYAKRSNHLRVQTESLDWGSAAPASTP